MSIETSGLRGGPRMEQWVTRRTHLRLRLSRGPAVKAGVVLAVLLVAPLTATPQSWAAPAAAVMVDATPDTDGTANLGPCDSLGAVSATGAISYACWGSDATDFKALRRAYASGGMGAVRRASTHQQRAGAVAAASGGTQLSGYANVKGSQTLWTYFGTIHYGTIDTRGNLTEYGQVFVRDVITLSGNFAQFKYTFQRVVGHGSDVAVELRNYFTNIGWSGGSYLCPRTAYLAGHTATCNHATYILGYSGNGFYAHSQTKWWNAVSRNPSSPDGSWTVLEPHGPMDCVRGRPQQCIFR